MTVNKMFYFVFFLIIFLITFYAFYRGLQLMPQILSVKIIYSVVYFLSAAAFILRMIFGDTINLNLSYALSVVGFTWFVVVSWALILILFIDITRIINYFTHIYPTFIKENPAEVKRIILYGFSAVVVISLIAGNYKFNHPNVVEIEVEAKNSNFGKSMKIVMASDLHLSSYIGQRDMKRFVELINKQEPDLVLFGGDIADRNLEPIVKLGLGDYFKQLKSKYGTFAVSGNHEFYGGSRDKIFEYLTNNGVTILTDRVVMLDSSVYLIGREDRTNQSQRKPLKSIVDSLDNGKPIIVLDHQPYNLNEAAQNGVTLQLSGHTHLGQFWPGTMIVKWMYELPHGFLKKGNTNFYVSSGLGIWGPKIRLGSNSEIVVINLLY